MPHPILVATTNPGKVQELRAMLDFDVQWLSLDVFPAMPEVVEDGSTFSDNASKKAMAYAQASGHWTLSDDSGLVVDALDGEPGVRSARYAGLTSPDRAAVDRANIKKLLEKLRSVPAEKRTARFICRICLASPESILLESEGSIEGLIIDQPRGCNGFGYDPVFWIPNLGKTAAELPSQEKNAISHRGRAIRNLKPRLMELLQIH